MTTYFRLTLNVIRYRSVVHRKVYPMQLPQFFICFFILLSIQNYSLKQIPLYGFAFS